MNIAIASTRAELVATVQEVCDRLGTNVVPWTPTEGACPDAHVVIIDGIEEFVEHGDLPYHVVAIVASEELDLFPECPHPVTDFLVRPIHRGELEAPGLQRADLLFVARDTLDLNLPQGAP